MPQKLPPSGFGIDLQFQEQIDFLRKKINLPTERWDDIWKRAHDRAFVVAGAQKADLLADLHAAVLKGAQGGTLEAFRKDFKTIVAKHGWTGWTGEGSKGGEAWRTRVIYDTNLRTSYAAGRWQQLNDPELLAIRPYWRYVHQDGQQYPRPLHASWQGMTLRHDHPFWKSHFPPNGWGCKCRVTAVAGPKDGDATEPPDGWDSVSDKTGELPGIDRGWGYAPGANANADLRDLIDAKKLKLPPEIAAELARDARKVIGKSAPVPPPSVEAKLEFVAAKTAKGAADWAVSVNLADFADYTGIAPEVANAWNKSLFDHLQEFPLLRENQKFVGTAQGQFARYTQVARERYVEKLVQRGIPRHLAVEMSARTIKKPKVNGTTYAQSWSQDDAKGVAVNAKWGKDPKAFQAALAKDVAQGFHPLGCDSIRSVVDHELAHQLDDLLNLHIDPEVIAAYKAVRLKGIKTEVSGYADKNIKEFIAECWAEFCNNPEPRDAARNVAAIVRARYRSRFDPAA